MSKFMLPEKKQYYWVRQNSFDFEIARIEGKLKSIKDHRRTASVIFGVRNEVGGVVKALQIMQENEINVTHIDTRLSLEKNNEFEIFVEIEAENARLKEVIESLRKDMYGVLLIDSPPSTPSSPAVLPASLKQTPSQSSIEEVVVGGLSWFPKKISDLDITMNRVLMLNSEELATESKGFSDPIYLERRKYFADLAFAHKHGDPVQRIVYTDEELATWKTVYTELKQLHEKHACKTFLENFSELEKHCGYSSKTIPQIEDINFYLKEKSGMQLRPVAGYLSPRDFLTALAFRVFPSTQYIRHSSEPFYTPEPDCCHELIGHVAMLADPTFAQFSQEIGLAAIGAQESTVDQLATLYFFTIEFGLCLEENELKVYGAGLLSCANELKHVVSGEAIVNELSTEAVVNKECLLTTFQDSYFYTETFDDAKQKLSEFSKNIKRPFEVLYDPYTQTMKIIDKSDKVKTFISQIKSDMARINNALQKVKI